MPKFSDSYVTVDNVEIDVSVSEIINQLDEDEKQELYLALCDNLNINCELDPDAQFTPINMQEQIELEEFFKMMLDKRRMM